MFTEPIDQITFADIHAFMQKGHRKSPVLDYRTSWPRDLAKTMVGMANTQGGVILIGVEEGPASERLPSIPGIDLDNGAEDLWKRVINTAHKEIHPPITPEVTVCPLDTDSNRGVVVIRIAPSDHAPHATDNQRHVYVRVDGAREPNRLATLRDIEFLWARRQRTEEQWDILLQGASERASWFFPDASEPSLTPRLQAWVIPHFSASEAVLPLQQTAELMKTYRPTSDVLRGRWSFPHYAHKTRSIPMGYCAYGNESRHQGYAELSTSGLVFTELRLHNLDEQEAWQKVHFPFVLSQIDGLLKFAAHAYQEGEAVVLLQVHAELQNVQGALLYAVPGLWGIEVEKHRGPNATLELVHETVVSKELEERRPILVQETARRMLWSFGYTLDSDEGFERWYQVQVLEHR